MMCFALSSCKISLMNCCNDFTFFLSFPFIISLTCYALGWHLPDSWDIGSSSLVARNIVVFLLSLMKTKNTKAWGVTITWGETSKVESLLSVEASSNPPICRDCYISMSSWLAGAPSVLLWTYQTNELANRLPPIFFIFIFIFHKFNLLFLVHPWDVFLQLVKISFYLPANVIIRLIFTGSILSC